MRCNQLMLPPPVNTNHLKYIYQNQPSQWISLALPHISFPIHASVDVFHLQQPLEHKNLHMAFLEPSQATNGPLPHSCLNWPSQLLMWRKGREIGKECERDGQGKRKQDQRAHQIFASTAVRKKPSPARHHLRRARMEARCPDPTIPNLPVAVSRRTKISAA